MTSIPNSVLIQPGFDLAQQDRLRRGQRSAVRYPSVAGIDTAQAAIFRPLHRLRAKDFFEGEESAGYQRFCLRAVGRAYRSDNQMPFAHPNSNTCRAFYSDIQKNVIANFVRTIQAGEYLRRSLTDMEKPAALDSQDRGRGDEIAGSN